MSENKIENFIENTGMEGASRMGKVILKRTDKSETEEILKVIRNLKPKEQQELLIFLRGIEFAKSLQSELPD